MQTVKKKPENVSKHSDLSLIALARTGDGAAFVAIMQRYNQQLVRAARGIVWDEMEAEDVVQEAYMRAFAALPGFRGDSSLGTWLTRIVLNEALGRMRRRRPTEGLDAFDRADGAENSRPVMFPCVGTTPDPEVAAIRSEIRRLLEDAVDDLPEAFRLVFVMREIDGLSIEETSANLEVRPETVKTRLHRARRLLRKDLGGKLSLRDTFPFQ